jgi:hypothetical protein
MSTQKTSEAASTPTSSSCRLTVSPRPTVEVQLEEEFVDQLVEFGVPQQGKGL